MQRGIKKLRTKVSGDKNRFEDGEYDLDLTYITDRIIAMSFPAEGVESTYRNSINDVANMLDTYHKGHYLIFNVSRRNYDFEKFHKQVKSIGWEDHTAPPLHLLWEICYEMDQFLSTDSENVVVVHCLAGKGRTGSIIAAYLLYCGLFDSAESSMLYFAYKRSLNNWGVAVPSQRRYVKYVERLLSENFQDNQILYLHSIELSSIPAFDVPKLGCNFEIEIKNLSNPDRPLMLFSLYDTYKLLSNNKDEFLVDFFLEGDIQVEITHRGTLKKSTIAKFQFHTNMLEDNRVIFTKRNLDDAFNDHRLPDKFYIALNFEDFEESSESFIAYKRFIHNKIPTIDLSHRCSQPDGSLPFHFNSSEELQRMITESRNVTTGAHSVEKGGWLEKQGDTLKMWKNRWVSLKSECISYYKDPKNVNPIGVIKLRDINEVVTFPDLLIFEISTPERTHRLKARDDQDMYDWVEAIEFARMSILPSEIEIQNVESDLTNWILV